MNRERIGILGIPQGDAEQRGSAIVPTLVVISALAIFAVALLSAGINGAKTVNRQADEYRLASAVESVGVLTVERLWSDYTAAQGGAAGTILSFRAYLNSIGVPDAGPGGAPDATQGTSFAGTLALPIGKDGGEEFDRVNVEAVQLLRRDEGQSTQLFLTVSASSNIGDGIVNPQLNRAVQQVYTVEPADFEGFDYALLANNVNCIFCHTQVDSVDRFFNTDGDLASTFDRVKVGTLESLMLRHNMDGPSGAGWINDWDSDSYVAGTVYVRGTAMQQNGKPIGANDWSSQSFKGWKFDSDGKIVEDTYGLSVTALSPAGSPPGPGENLYLNYPTDYSSMVDGKLPPAFPPPIPDDGGWDDALGGPVAAAVGNKLVDDIEFDTLSSEAMGWVTSGNMTILSEGQVIDTVAAYTNALLSGGVDSMQGAVKGNVVLTGTYANPIKIQDTIAIDGDLIISGYVQGAGSLVVRGNVYIPSNLTYLDGKQYLPGDQSGSPTGPQTFGVAPDGTTNALGLAAGGNIVVGDYQKPSKLTPDFKWQTVAPGAIVSGAANGKWNFALAELSLFNRGEWAKTQPTLPALGESTADPSKWTAPNASYVPGYVPRYYNFGEGQEIPIYNKGYQAFLPDSQSWIGLEEVPLGWNAAMQAVGKIPLLTEVLPGDTSSPYLYDALGNPKAAVSSIGPTGGWITPAMYKLGVDYYASQHPPGTPFQLDGLYYTNNAIFGIVNRDSSAKGSMQVNGALVAADMGVLTPGSYNGSGAGTSENTPGSIFKVGLQLNYDKRVKNMLNVVNPYQVTIKRTLWRPTANML